MNEALIIREGKEEDNLLLAAIIRVVFEGHDLPKNGTMYFAPSTIELY